VGDAVREERRSRPDHTCAPDIMQRTPAKKGGKLSACKPGSVSMRALARLHTGRSFLSAFSHPNAPAAYPRLDVVRHRGRDGPSLAAYLALLRLGFTEPSPLPMTRWALTPPFHPYRRLHGGGLFSVALSVAYRSRRMRPGVTWQSTLWSPDFPRCTAPKRHTSRPSGRQLPVLQYTARRPRSACSFRATR
jgi:hypothetical protein